MDNKLEERLRAKADYTDRHFDNTSLGELYRKAADEITRLNAENERLRGALIECGRNAGAILSDKVSTDFLMFVPGEVKARLALITKASRDSGHETRT